MSELPATRLARLDACALSDALDQLKVGAAVSGIAPLTVQKRISGQVVTVRLAAGPPPSGALARHLCTTAIEAASPGDVIVVEQRNEVDAAGWGGMLSNAAKVAGLSGVIVDGPARDIDEARELGFPVYARSSTARTARGRIHEAETGGEVRIGDIRVRSGDWVVADSSGAVFIAASAIDRVLDAAEQIARREALMTRAVLAGEAISIVMGAGYETMLASTSVEIT